MPSPDPVALTPSTGARGRRGPGPARPGKPGRRGSAARPGPQEPPGPAQHPADPPDSGRQLPAAAPDVAVERVRADGLVKDCSGWDVYDVASTTSDSKNSAQLRAFYRAPSAACGGTLVVWDPALPAFPLPEARVQPVVFSAAPPIPELISTASEITAPLPSALLFDTGSAILRPEADAALVDVFKAATDYPAGGIEVRAYTDDVGTVRDDMRLSKARAGEVCRWLIAQGIDPGRLSPSGYGESDPAQPGTGKQARQANRRVVIVIHHQAA